MNLQKLKDEARKEFDEKFKKYGFFESLSIKHLKGEKEWNPKQDVKDFIDSLIDKAYEESRRDFIEAEIERKKGMKKETHTAGYHSTSKWYKKVVEGFNQAIDEDIAYLQSLTFEK